MNNQIAQKIQAAHLAMSIYPNVDEALACSRGQNPSLRFPLPTSGWLIGLNGAHLGEDMRLYPGTNSVGSSARCNIVVTSPGTGRQHAVIDVLSGESAMIYPGSTQRELYVNGEICTAPSLLTHGDTLQIGEQHFAYVSLLPNSESDKKSITFLERFPTKYFCTAGWLVALNGRNQGRDYRLFPGENRVGYQPGLEVVIFDQKINQRHAVITRHAENWTIVPVTITEPILINGVPSTGTALQSGDILNFGQNEFFFRTLKLVLCR